jgi:hypothetical protein
MILILPGTGRGTMRSMVEGAQCHAPLPLHHEQVRSAPHCAAMSGGHGDLLILTAAVPLPVPGRI